MLVAIPLALAGLLAMVAPVQWRRRRWLGAGRWLVRTASSHVVAGLPLIGLFAICLGLSFLWPVWVAPAMVAAVMALWVVTESAREAGTGNRRLPVMLRDDRQVHPSTVSANAPAPSSPDRGVPRLRGTIAHLRPVLGRPYRGLHRRPPERRAG
jgi:hypothetical protein